MTAEIHRRLADEGRLEVMLKYAHIDYAGKMSINPNLGEFNYPPESELDKILGVAAEFDVKQSEIFQQVADKLLELEKEMGVKILLAGRDFPAHATILDAVAEDKDKTKEAAGNFENDKCNHPAVADLESFDFEFDKLLFDKTNLILACSRIPPQVLAARQELGGLYKDAGLKERSISNILHSTLSRIVGFPPHRLREDVLKKYVEEVRKLQILVSRQHVVLKAIGIQFFDAPSFLNKLSE